MKLNNFNEAFERMGTTALNEADDKAEQKKNILKSRIEKLSGLKEVATKAIQNIDLVNDLDKFKNYLTILDWIVKLLQSFKNLNSSDYREFSQKVRYADYYMNQIADSINKGKLVHESLLKESLNYICENKDN